MVSCCPDNKYNCCSITLDIFLGKNPSLTLYIVRSMVYFRFSVHMRSTNIRQYFCQLALGSEQYLRMNRSDQIKFND